ncbi:hypothetical protein LAESUDRAFT_641849 [Laetiporus sulphureus 93-53]|uniref:Uncharacterized protein n=1 Tax=Laetiporus sulphureus 93-53 TaxID=1314785 RepID=A0A165HXC4_9APHY|nr:hypothetical protein LAESUDRAFT_641849 [Laetiporus sulphureus 93-53]
MIAIHKRATQAFPLGRPSPSDLVHEPKLYSNTSRTCGTNVVVSSTDSGLEAFSHNPADDSFAPLPDRTGANTKYLNERFLSSRSLLVGEQSNAYRILLRYDRKSRHRRIKKQRRYEHIAGQGTCALGIRPAREWSQMHLKGWVVHSFLELWVILTMALKEYVPGSARRHPVPMRLAAYRIEKCRRC